MAHLYVRSILPQSPVAALFHYNSFDATDTTLFHSALQLFSAPLTDNRLYNPLLQLSMYNHFQEWCSRNANEYYQFVLHLLQHTHAINTSAVKLSSRIYDLLVDKIPAGSLAAEPDMRRELLNWWLYSPASVFVCPCSIHEKGTDLGHNVCLLFQKNTGTNTLTYLFVEPYGDFAKQNINVNALFFVKLKALFPMAHVSELAFTCHELQKDFGDNCVQWQLLLLTLFALGPQQNPEDILDDLNMQPHVNILFFSLYMYMYICSIELHFPTQIMFHPVNMLPKFYDDVNYVSRKVDLDTEVRDKLAQLLFIQPLMPTPVDDVVQELLRVEQHFMRKGLLPFTDALGSMFDVANQFYYKTPRQLVREHQASGKWSSKNVGNVRRQFKKKGIFV